MYRRNAPPPPPSASSTPTAGAGPSTLPTSMSNSSNATIMWKAADIMSRLFTPRSLYEGLPRGQSTARFNMETENKKRARGLPPPAVVQGNTSGSPFSEPPPARWKKGRRPGPAKKQLDALGKGGTVFIPHVILVNPGEDIVSKIMAFSEQAPRTICVLSGHGAVSYVTLCQPALSGGTISYEGKFELISLSGTYLFAEYDGGRWRRSGVLMVVLGGADGQVVAGAVSGLLVATAQVQVIVGSFRLGKKKDELESNIQKPGSSAAPPQHLVIYDNSTQSNQNSLYLSRLWSDQRQQ